MSCRYRVLHTKGRPTGFVGVLWGHIGSYRDAQGLGLKVWGLGFTVLVIQGLYRDNGKEHGNGVYGLGFPNPAMTRD